MLNLLGDKLSGDKLSEDILSWDESLRDKLSGTTFPGPIVWISKFRYNMYGLF